MKMKIQSPLRPLALLAFAAALQGCTTVPPGTVYSDSPDYQPDVEPGGFAVLPPPAWATPYPVGPRRYWEPGWGVGFYGPPVYGPGYYPNYGRPPHRRPHPNPPQGDRPSPQPPVVNVPRDPDPPLRPPSVRPPIDPGSTERMPAPRSPSERLGGPGINNVGGS